MMARKTKKMMPSPSPSAAAETPILEQEAKVTRKRKPIKPSGQSPLPFGPGHTQLPPEQEQEADPHQRNSTKKSNCKNPGVLSNREIIKMRIELRKQQPLPQGFVPAMSATEHNPNYSSPFGAFFDQFCYKPVRQDRNRLLPRTPDRLARLPPRGYPSFESSQLTANATSKSSKDNTSVASKSKQPGSDSGSASASGSQAKVNVKEKKNPEKKTRVKKQRIPPPLLTYAEKHSDKYRRLPLDQLVPPPRSPHKLLQEEYAWDPWKVIVICMLLNLTQGKQVRKKVHGFFILYPDAQTASNADPEKMAAYLAPLGLQRVKTIRIQQFSREYVEKEWTYITELCGVGKYAADAYAIFCAGRATEVVPEDHKLVDYWKYVCFQLPMSQQENGGSDDRDEEESDEEMGKNEVPAKNHLLLLPPQGTGGLYEGVDSKGDFDEVGDSGSKSKEVLLKPTLPLKENVASSELTNKHQQKRKVPLAEVTESPQLKRVLSAESPQLKSNVTEHGLAESNVEKLFKEKCDTYWFLAQEVSALEAKQPGMFKVPFLKLAEDKAHTLDAKIKKQMVAETEVHMRRGDIEKEVTNTLINLLK